MSTLIEKLRLSIRETRRLSVPLQIATWIGWVLMAAAFAALIFFFIVYVIYFIKLVQFPFDYDQGEGLEMWSAVLFSRGDGIYVDNGTYPFYASPYGPVFPALLVPFIWLFGPQIWIGRVWAFCISLIIGGTIYWIVQHETRDRLAGALVTLAFFASNFVYQVGPLFRQHFTMLLFGLLGVVMMARAMEEEDKKHYLWLSLGFLMLAGYTKPLAVDAVAAAFIFFFLRQPRKAVNYAIGFAAVAGLIFWLLNVITDGQWWVNMITANSNPFIPNQSMIFFKLWFRLHGVLIVLTVGYVLYTVYLDRISAYTLYFLVSMITGGLSGKWGAGFSYFSAAIVASCIGAGLGLGILRDWLREKSKETEGRRVKLGQTGLATWGIVVPLLFLYQVRSTLHLPLNHPLTRPVAQVLNIPDYDPNRFRQDYFDTVGYTQLGHFPTQEDIDAGWRIVEYVKSSPKPAFTEEAMFAVYAEKEVVTDPSQLFNLYNNNALDTSEMEDMINRQEFGVVVFRARIYPYPVLEAIGQNYDVVEQIEMNGFTYDVLLPRDKNAGQ